MNTHNEQSHTEIEFASSNAMEQAALLKARSAMARWRSADVYVAGWDSAAETRMKQEWFAALEQRLYEWIGRGGLAQERAPAERSCVD